MHGTVEISREAVNASFWTRSQDEELMAIKLNQDFWKKDFVTMTDYFSHTIVPLQREFGIPSEDLLYSLGQLLGEKIAQKYPELDAIQVLVELQKVWQKLDLGHLEIGKKDRVELSIQDCTICGQLPGTGGMYDCAFHEGFFQSILNAKLKRKVELRQITDFEGSAGTWCRRYVASDARL